MRRKPVQSRGFGGVAINMPGLHVCRLWQAANPFGSGRNCLPASLTAQQLDAAEPNPAAGAAIATHQHLGKHVQRRLRPLLIQNVIQSSRRRVLAPHGLRLDGSPRLASASVGSTSFGASVMPTAQVAAAATAAEATWAAASRAAASLDPEARASHNQGPHRRHVL